MLKPERKVTTVSFLYNVREQFSGRGRRSVMRGMTECSSTHLGVSTSRDDPTQAFLKDARQR
jgi:hypothetical protein